MRAGALAAALAGHAGLGALLLLAAPRHLSPPVEPLAVALLPDLPAPSPAAAPEVAAEVSAEPAGADLSDPPPVEAAGIAVAAPRPRVVTAPVARPVAVAVAPAGAAAEVAVAADAVAAWQAALSAWIERHRRYPPAARFRQEEGVVQIRFSLDPDGRVLAVALDASSGSEVLDRAAQALLSGAVLPPPPPGLAAERRRVTVPIRYRLE